MEEVVPKMARRRGSGAIRRSREKISQIIREIGENSTKKTLLPKAFSGSFCKQV